MVIQKSKLDIVLARRQSSLTDLRDQMSPVTLSKINNGKDVRAKTVGKLASILHCDPSELVEPPSAQMEVPQ